MGRTADVVIVGGGVTGLCTALALKERGAGRVVVLERHFTGAGQSGRAAGVIRGCVGHPTVAATQLEGQEFYGTFESRYGIPVEVHRTGYLLVARSHERAHVETTVAVAESAGCRLGLVSAEEAAEIQPGLDADPAGVHVFEPGGLYVDPAPATQAIRLAATAAGVSIREGCEVGEIVAEGGRVAGVTSGDGNVSAGIVLVATSVWGTPQLARLGIDVPVRPHIAQMAFFHVPTGSGQRLRTTLFDSRAGLYMRPEGTAQMFVGRKERDFHDPDGPLVDPDDYKQTAEYGAVERMHAGLSITLPSMRDGFVHRTYACTYDVTPDEMPILEQAGGIDGLFFAVGFSGGGFSAAPWVGRRMAESITSGEKPREIEPFKLERFETGETIAWSNTPD